MIAHKLLSKQSGKVFRKFETVRSSLSPFCRTAVSASTVLIGRQCPKILTNSVIRSADHARNWAQDGSRLGDSTSFSEILGTYSTHTHTHSYCSICDEQQRKWKLRKFSRKTPQTTWGFHREEEGCGTSYWQNRSPSSSAVLVVVVQSGAIIACCPPVGTVLPRRTDSHRSRSLEGGVG